MSLSREQICRHTSRKLASSGPVIGRLKAMIGFDGFVDEIIVVVDKRHGHDRYDAIATIEQFGRKIVAAAGASSNYELVIKQMKLGGNGPIMANALAAMGLAVTYVGSVGHPAIHPVFEELARRAKVIGIAEPAHTDALEFDDGKLMLGKSQSLAEVNWDNLVQRVGTEQLREMMARATLIGMVNWTMLPHLSAIWQKMLVEIMPGLDWREKHLFIDLADPEKRTAGDLRAALTLLTSFQQYVDVTLGLNLKESMEVAEVLGVEPSGDPDASIEPTASAIRQKLNLACVVIHPRKGAAAAVRDHSASFAGPFIQRPKISTGAGDHFNAGFCLGRVIGLALEECLCAGVAASGHYVRTGISPGAAELARFIEQLPSPEA